MAGQSACDRVAPDETDRPQGPRRRRRSRGRSLNGPALGRKDCANIAPLRSPRRRVLVVEDDAPLAHLYCTALALQGMECIRAGDGLAALRYLEQNQPDLVLLDLMLPSINGWTVLREFTSNPSTSAIPVIVVTGVDPPPDLPDALLVLRKPCDPDHVAKIVADHLPARRA